MEKERVGRLDQVRGRETELRETEGSENDRTGKEAREDLSRERFYRVMDWKKHETPHPQCGGPQIFSRTTRHLQGHKATTPVKRNTEGGQTNETYAHYPLHKLIN